MYSSFYAYDRFHAIEIETRWTWFRLLQTLTPPPFDAAFLFLPLDFLLGTIILAF
ncbi:hypothetical protein Hdeb2414_s0024g00649621 [Helianthus debilis subsp. tardiflorus]